MDHLLGDGHASMAGERRNEKVLSGELGNDAVDDNVKAATQIACRSWEGK